MSSKRSLKWCNIAIVRLMLRSVSASLVKRSSVQGSQVANGDTIQDVNCVKRIFTVSTPTHLVSPAPQMHSVLVEQPWSLRQGIGIPHPFHLSFRNACMRKHAHLRVEIRVLSSSMQTGKICWCQATCQKITHNAERC